VGTYGAETLVEGNKIGTNLAGDAAVPNGGYGVYLGPGSSGSTVGGTSTSAANLISGNSSSGVYIDATSCLVEGNLIGTNLAGAAAIPNGSLGIDLEAAGDTIGGTSAAAANLISGNTSTGVFIGSGAGNCLVEGNSLGTDLTGGMALPNGLYGIYAAGTGATIGGTSAGSGNLVSGNSHTGIVIEANCLVEGNRIGTNASGSIAIANGRQGIYVDTDGSAATIGGSASGTGNLISGNALNGIYLSAPGCIVQGNLIGTDLAGDAAIPNSQYGVDVAIPLATVGGSVAGAGNLISGNALGGLLLEASAALVEGNLIGTSLDGAVAIPNNQVGIRLENAAIGSTIGGTSAGSGNVVSGNNGTGILLVSVTDCWLEGNLIGTDKTGGLPLGNAGSGVLLGPSSLQASQGNVIGVEGGGNVIAFNQGPGVAAPPGGGRNPIRYNAIFSNVGPGVDLGNDGATPNLPNGSNNTPTLVSDDGGVITGTLNAAPNQSYLLDFYANLPSDASAARPQGRQWLGWIKVLTSLTGDVAFSFPYAPFPGQPMLTATATEQQTGTTSEFSPPLGYQLTPSGATFSATVGVPFLGTVARFTTTDNSANPGDFTATIDWGDGTANSAGTVVASPGGFVVTGAHTFTTTSPNEPVTVSITDTRGFGQGVASSLANVTSPGGILTPFGRTVPFVAGTLSGRVVAGFTDTDSHAYPGQFTAAINWGDGTASTAGSVSIDGGGFDVTGSHAYLRAGTQPITVAITDSVTGAAVTAVSTANIDPVPITIRPRNFGVTGKKNFSGTVAYFTDGDPRIDPTFYTATIDWGDGSVKTTGSISGTNPFSITASHTFPSFQNTDLVTITVTDKNGRTASAVDRVVDPPAVLALQTGGLPVPAGGRFQGAVAVLTDSGPGEAASSYKATINWGGGRRTAGMITGNNGRFVVSARHAFGRGGSRSALVTVTVSDHEGRTVSATEPVSFVGQRQRSLVPIHTRSHQ
jgi:hypothetical protein